MGNCVCKDYCYSNNPNSSRRRHLVVGTEAEQTSMIKVVTTTGGIMELYAPITVDQITSEFPNHGMFLNPNPTSHPPLLHNDNLCPGQLYYLLPLTLSSSATTTTNNTVSTPYRMSVDAAVRTVQPDHADLVTRYNGSGVWKVRLVINPEQLSEILSQDNKTQQLIESVRTVAKCSNNGSGVKTPSLSSSVGSSSNSEQSSVSSCTNFHRNKGSS